MFHIILFILKLIGIILASVLGILIFLILVVLLVPIRYQADASNKGKIHVEARVTWLFHLLYFRITYIENRFVMKLHIGGKVFYDSDKPKEAVKKRVKRVAKRAEKKVETKVEEKVEEQAEIQIEKRDGKQSKEKEVIEKNAEKHSKEQEVIKTNEEKLAKKQEVIETNEEKLVKKQVEIEKQAEKQVEKQATELKTKQVNKNQKGKKIKSVFLKINSIFLKIKSLFLKIKQIIQKIKGLFSNIKGTISSIKNKIMGIGAIYQKIKAFFKNEINKAGLKHIISSLRKIFKHIRPTKLRIAMEFGTGDPCSTGQALGAFAIFYGYYGEAIQIMPNFDIAIMEGTIFLKGRIRLFTLLIICIKLILDKKFRQFIKNLRTFKEEI